MDIGPWIGFESFPLDVLVRLQLDELSAVLLVPMLLAGLAAIVGSRGAEVGVRTGDSQSSAGRGEIGEGERGRRGEGEIQQSRTPPLSNSPPLPLSGRATDSGQRTTGHSPPSRALHSFAVVALLFLGTAGLLLASNLLIVLACWQLTALAGYGLLQWDSAARQPRRMVLAQRAADLFLIAGMLLAWSRFGTFELEELRQGVTAALDPRLPADMVRENLAVLTAIGLAWFVGIAGRCGQFPLLIWLDEVAEAPATNVESGGCHARPGEAPVRAWHPGGMPAGRISDVWLSALGSPLSASCLLLSALLLPSGFALLARTEFFIAASASTRLAVAAVGALTGVLAAAAAMTRPTWRGALTYASAALFGWMFVGLATAAVSGRSGAVLLFVTHCFATTALFLVAERGQVRERERGRGGEGESGRRSSPPLPHSPPLPLPHSPALPLSPSAAVQRTTDDGHRSTLNPNAFRTPLSALALVASLVLASGAWGQNAVLAAVWDIADVPDGGPFAAAIPLLLALLVVGQFLLAAALFRALFRAWNAERQRSEISGQIGEGERRQSPTPPLSHSPPLQPLPIALVSAAVAVLFVPVILREWWSRLMVRAFVGEPETAFVETAGALAAARDPLAAVPGLLAGLLGIVVAWMIFSRPSPWAERLTHRLGPLMRLSRNRFYLEDFYSLCLVLPIRGLAQLLRFMDWFLVDGVVLVLPGKLPAALARVAQPLHNSSAQLAALAVLLALGVLLVVLG